MRRAESHLMSVMKALSWRLIATMTTIIISYFVTHRLSFALAIGSTEMIAKIVLYYFHERIWLTLQSGTLTVTKGSAPRHSSP